MLFSADYSKVFSGMCNSAMPQNQSHRQSEQVAALPCDKGAARHAVCDAKAMEVQNQEDLKWQ